MRTGTRPPLRGGFTLIELLIVISILAMLAALSVAIIGRVRTGQNSATTEATVKKAQVELNAQLMTVSEEANNTNHAYHQALKSFCDGDTDRAKALHFYLAAKRDFPQTFAEARNPLTVPGLGSVPRHTAFAQVPAGSLTWDQDSAILLYMIVLGKGNKGRSSTEEAFSGATTTIGNLPAFRDGYGTHIAFYRWYGAVAGSEVQSAPYVNPKDAPNYDKFDPLGRLRTWGNATNRNFALTVLNTPAGIPPVNFDGLNKVLTVVSAGPDKTFNTPDDVFGFRLAQYGAKGN